MALELKNKFIDYIDSRITNGGYPLEATDDFIAGAIYAYTNMKNAVDSLVQEPK
jgi:hypothetical protein